MAEQLIVQVNGGRLLVSITVETDALCKQEIVLSPLWLCVLTLTLLGSPTQGVTQQYNYGMAKAYSHIQ